MEKLRKKALNLSNIKFCRTFLRLLGCRSFGITLFCEQNYGTCYETMDNSCVIPFRKVFRRDSGPFIWTSFSVSDKEGRNLVSILIYEKKLKNVSMKYAKEIIPTMQLPCGTTNEIYSSPSLFAWVTYCTFQRNFNPKPPFQA
jgi:hypothetical protein